MSEYVEGELRYYSFDLGPDLDQVWLLPTSDAHYGNPYHSSKHLDRHLTFLLENPFVYSFGNGDLAECVLKSSKGDVYRQIGTPQDQRDYIIERLYPVRHKFLGMTQGNHEARIYNETGIDICADIAKALNIPYRPEGMMVRISFGRGNNRDSNKPFVFWGYFSHGYGGARTKGAKLMKAERRANYVSADWVCESHDHDSMATPIINLEPDKRSHTDSVTGFTSGKIRARRQVVCKSGAFLKWGGYAETHGHPPVDLTMSIIKMLSKDEGPGTKPIVRVLI